MVTPAPSSRRILAPGDKLGKHEVIRQIAVGGMAELYLTRTVGLEGFEKLVCLKRILPQFSDNHGFVSMFLNEARLAATLHHPNVAQVYDIGQDNGDYFFSMEYVHGEDLGRVVTTARQSGVPISLDCALTLAAGLCAGLHHAHERTSPEGKPLGVVHRDVSPTNVLVSYDGAVKLVDFGIARLAGEPSSQTGLKGKISYMSPEQCRGRAPLDRRSDVFSVGSILYELTTGRLPFVDATEYAVLLQIVNRDAEPPSRLVPGYPPALEAIVMRALARDPNRRFSTALELQNQLEDFAHDARLRVSPLVLARLMSTLFPARLEEWDHARAQGAFFVEQHVVRTLIESGKTPDAASGYLPQPLPPVDDGSGGVTTISGPPTPDMDALERTELGPRPRLSPPRPVPRMPTPPPGPMATPPPGAIAAARLGPSRMPTPPPTPAAPPARGSPRPAPVPNMPGAVPIMMPLPAPPVPSGGTLVSSATQAGRQPPAVAAQMPHGSGNLGSPMTGPGAGQNGPGGPANLGAAPGGYGQGGPGGFSPGHAGHPGPAASGFAGAPLAAPGFAAPPAAAPPLASGYAEPAGAVHAHEIASNSVGDITEQVRPAPAARPTLMVRVPQKSRLPFALGVVAVAGAAVGVWLAIGADLVSDPPRGTVRESARPAEIAPASSDTDTATGAAPAAPTESSPTGDPPAAVGGEPAANTEAAAAQDTAGGAPSPVTGANPPESGSDPAPGSPPTGDPSTAAKAPDGVDTTAAAAVPAEPVETKKRPTKAGVQDARTKGKPRGRRGQKPDAKEQQWNDDSPFLPVAPKR